MILSLILAGINLVHAGVYVYVSHWGGQGSEDGQFNYPVGIDVDDEGYVYREWRHRACSEI